MEQVYEITITGRESHTWQGHLCCGDGSTPFRSEMELLLALDRLLSATDLQAATEDTEHTQVFMTREGGKDGWRPT